MLPFCLIGGAMGASGVVTLTDAAVSETNKSPVGAWHAGIRLSADGKLYSITGDDGAGGPIYTALNTGTDWVIPNFSGGSGFEVQADITGDALDVSSDTTGSYITVTGDLDWYYSEELLDRSGTLTLSVRRVGGSALDSSSHALTLTFA